MGKDLIIGAGSNYDWDKLKYWVNSIKKSGFTGDTVLVASNITKETIDKLLAEGVKLALYGKQDEKGNFRNDVKNAPHVERFFYMWNFLQMNVEKYTRVIATDTRDVVFNRNPQEELDDLLKDHDIVAASEELLYKNEPWGNQNLYETFGPYFHNRLSDKPIYNVGVIAGRTESVTRLFINLFQMSINRQIPIVDQAVYNFLIQECLDKVNFVGTKIDSWAINLGTSVGAITAGKGDLGYMAANDRKVFDKYLKDYMAPQPIFDGHRVYAPHGDNYAIIHQWDRIPALKEEIEKTYGDV